MIILFSLSASLAFLMYVFQRSNMLEEYFDLLSIDKISFNLFYFKEYKNFLAKNAALDDWKTTYNDYLIYRHSSFFIRLIYCPLCLSFWLSLFICCLMNLLWATLVIAFLSCACYFILHSLVKLSQF